MATAHARAAGDDAKPQVHKNSIEFSRAKAIPIIDWESHVTARRKSVIARGQDRFLLQVAKSFATWNLSP